MWELDHVAFGARDAAAFGGELTRLGFVTTEGGSCCWMAGDAERTAPCVSVVFPGSYLDVIELRAPGWEQYLQSSPVYARGAAPSGVMLSCASVEQARRTLLERGVRCDEPYEIVREQPGAEPSSIHYSAASLRAGRLPLGLIHDGAPEAMRHEAWMRHPNGAVDIARLHLASRSAPHTCAELARVLGTVAVDAEHELAVGNARIAVHEAPRDPYLSALHEQVDTTQRVVLLALELRTRSLSAAQAWLEHQDVDHVVLPRGVAVAPDAAYGCGMIFVQAAAT